MYKTILVPLDGSKRAEAILPYVEDMAIVRGSKVYFLQVLETDYLIGNYEDVASVSRFREDQERYVKEAETYLDGIRGEFREKGIDTGKVIAHGTVVQAIINAAEDKGADLIAIASHGRTGLARAFYGSVASGVLNRADRPLLIIRSRQA